jgi:UTP--glucose-1-phosphate uridylyltransferase
MLSSQDGLALARAKMSAAGVDQVAIATFAHYYDLLERGETGLIPEDTIEPIDMERLADVEVDDADAADAIAHTVVIKLNGGLGTSMGMDRAKSLLCVGRGLSFLDVMARQILHLRQQYDAPLPLLFMNSFRTSADTLDAVGRYEDLAIEGLPLEFLQNKEPKLLVDGLVPASFPKDPDLEWCPPGHGDIYPALRGSGMLDQLIDAGFRYAFVSNSDNLGAVLDPRILAWLAGSGAPFLMEVADRTASDRKGGHLARRRSDGGLILREIAQTPDEDVDTFQDVERHRYFNTNTLWIDLHALRDVLGDDGVIDLPMIVNRKTVDPSDKSSTAVIQLETAMGAAIGVFDGAAAMRVPRSRFVPVKTTNDLLSLRSDAYVITEGHAVQLAPERGGVPPFVDLDGDHFKLVGDFEAHFPHGAPSLVACDALHVHGDVTFGRDVVARGEVTVDGPATIADGTVLEG